MAQETIQNPSAYSQPKKKAFDNWEENGQSLRCNRRSKPIGMEKT